MRDTSRSVIRTAAVQFDMRRVASADEFETRCLSFIDMAATGGADFVIFPELLTQAVLSAAEETLPPQKALDALDAYTQRWCDFLQNAATTRKIHIIGGSHLCREENGDLKNRCFIALEDGTLAMQDKLHPTPNEARHWQLKGGDTLKTVTTPQAEIGVLVCYDSEFPEAARHLTDQGMEILFVPFCTDDRQGYGRVRSCTQARTVENQCYAVAAGTVGLTENVDNCDIHYAESCILTPCDTEFPPGGIAAIAAPAVETVIFADLDLAALIRIRENGTVQNLKDRRTDLYATVWHG